MPATSWTDERVQTLARLWRDGLSASQIAAMLAVTRNAVIGKVHRLGLSGRAKPSAPGAPRKSGRQRSRRTARRQLRIPPALSLSACGTGPAPSDGTATVVSIRHGQCRWPLGEPGAADFALCGRPAVRGAYCAAHAEIAYRPVSQRPPHDHLLKLAGLA